MKIECVNEADVMIVCPEIDNLDAYNAGDFKAEINAALGNGSGHGVLDMRHIQFVDSAGLGAILSAMRLVHGRQKRFVICLMTPPVRSLFELVRIYKVLDVCNSREEAMRLIGAT